MASQYVPPPPSRGRAPYPPAQSPAAQYPPTQYPPAGPYPQPTRPPYPPPGAGVPPQPAPPPPPPSPGWHSSQAPPPYGPAAPYGYAPTWRPPQRKSSAGAVIGGLIGVLAFVFVAIVVMSALLGADEKQDPVTPVAQPTATWDATSQPRATPTEADPTSEPSSAPALNRSVKSNTLYRAGMLARPRCPAGNVNIYNHAQLKALILKTGKCMDRAWAPALAKVGIRWTPPGWVIAQGRGRGPCGVFPPAGSVVPYYCPSNKTIYVSTSAVAKGYGVLGSWHGIITSMMGHEYGHHVQQLSGISDSWWQQMLATRSQSARLALTRRHELQATCFGGIFMRSVAASYPIPAARRDQLLTAYSYLGDQPGGPRDHGSTRNNAMWFRQGYMRPRPYQCNTWVMAASYVS